MSCSSSSYLCLGATGRTTLVLYTKPGCCLCDGLKEKLQVASLVAGHNPLRTTHLEVRDITTNARWEKAYQLEVPVLALVRGNGREEILPRLSARISVEQLQKKISAALEDDSQRHGGK